ncbi:MAG: DUF4465 domain-containing protein [Bacteroidales bacterium]
MKNNYHFSSKENFVKKILFSLLFMLLCSQGIKAATEQTILDLSSPANPVQFEFNANGSWKETYNDVDYTYWEAQTFMFSHLVEGPGSSWGGAVWNGFTVSRNADDANHSDNWTDNQWGCMAKGGISVVDNGVVKISSSRPYIIGYWNSWSKEQSLGIMFNDGKSYNPVGVYIANHPWPYYDNINGSAFASAMTKEGDYFKLIAHGVAADATEKTSDFLLAQYKEGSLKQSTNWEWFDLSQLGEVVKIYFTMESSDNGGYGMNTSAFFCLDRLTVNAGSDQSGVKNNYAEENHVSVYYSHDEESVNITATINAEVSVYRADGAKMLTSHIECGSNSIPFGNMPDGLYLIKCGNSVFKIIKR